MLMFFLFPFSLSFLLFPPSVTCAILLGLFLCFVFEGAYVTLLISSTLSVKQQVVKNLDRTHC